MSVGFQCATYFDRVSNGLYHQDVRRAKTTGMKRFNFKLLKDMFNQKVAFFI